MQTSFWAGAREGFRVFLPVSVGLVPWAAVTGMAMMSIGFTPVQAIGMNLFLFSGTAQLGTLPLIAAGVPVWLIVITALVLNLRFVIFSAALAQSFRKSSVPTRWLAGYLLTDGVFSSCLNKILAAEDHGWRLGYYFAPSLWSWFLWQVFGLVGVLTSSSIPKTWSLEFMGTIALIVLLAPLAKVRPMLVAAATGGATAVGLHRMPLKLGVIVAIMAGICAGFVAERWRTRQERV